MKLKTAREIRNHLFNSIDELNEAIRGFQGVSSEVDFQKYRLVCGTLMAEIYESLLGPIFREHPELRPKELRDIES